MERTKGEVMEKTLSAYRQLSPKRYRETSGLYYEDFEIGDTFEHRPGRTILDVDNTWFTLLTMNTQELHFDATYAAKTEWKKPLVDSTFTLALLTGMSVRTVSAKVVANLGWDKVKATHPVFAGDTLYADPPPPSARPVYRPGGTGRVLALLAIVRRARISGMRNARFFGTDSSFRKLATTVSRE
jgi:itaconyl-CoA hydratase